MPPEPSTEVLISRLSDPDLEVKHAALQALRLKRDAAACQPILRLLDDPAASVRRTAIFVLGELGCAEARQKLAAIAGSLSDDTDLITLLLTLRKLGGAPDDSVLRLALARNSPNVRAHALRSLGGSRTREAATILRQYLLEDSSSVVRAAAAASLENFPGGETVHWLSRSLTDPERGVRLEAIRSLGHMQDETAISTLIASRGREQDDRVVSAINSALVRLSPDRFAALLPPGTAASLYDPNGDLAPATVWLRDVLWYPASENIIFFNTGIAETDDLDGNISRYRYAAQGSKLTLVQLETGVSTDYVFKTHRAILRDQVHGEQRTFQIEFLADPVDQKLGPVIYWAAPQQFPKGIK